ncbi:BBL_G0054720.mRNA.1.CDS.1 [Saccharomyces cerevisiae]|nr:BBL_G0054720.mRNA.1.CDS.1 [Saccharomyces cerevisiae]CAI7381125.1 BBL_G0054720.mRNA.1.CDS.1 [Saccharomyces cerevisiae]
MVCRFVHHSRVIFISIYDFLSTKGKKTCIIIHKKKKKQNKRTLSHKQVYIMRIFRVLQNHILPLNFSQKILLAHQFFFCSNAKYNMGKKKKKPFLST